jgi:undecaprenyl-diphosphatase
VTLLHAIVLGFVQGATEFLPVSSKTHLVVVPALLGWRPPSLAFIVWLHLGTLVALVIYFFRQLLEMLSGLVKPGSGRRTLGYLVVASIPAAVLGLLFEKTFERFLSHPRNAAMALVATSAILVAGEWLAGTIGRRPARPLREHLTLRDSLTMGTAQVFALFPGVSRSGATISAGLAGGLRRAEAARFSFLMALAAITGAGLVELPKILHHGVGGPEVAGFLASLVTGYAVIAALLRYLRRNTLLPFAAYCAVMAVVGTVRLR